MQLNDAEPGNNSCFIKFANPYNALLALRNGATIVKTNFYYCDTYEMKKDNIVLDQQPRVSEAELVKAVGVRY